MTFLHRHPLDEADERLREHLRELAQELRRPHHDEAQRRIRRAAAARAGLNRRRQGTTIRRGLR